MRRTGFHRSQLNNSLLISEINGTNFYLTFYDDDILIFGDRRAINGVNNCLSSIFSTTDLGA